MGRVPTHWEILSLGQVGTLTKGTGGNKEDELPTGMPCVRYGDLYTTHKYFVENARSFIAPEVADQYTKIKFGDVLFAASGETADEIGKSAVNLLRGPAYCGGDVILFRPHGHLIPRYTGYMMDCEPIVHQKATMGRGFTVYHIYGKQLKYLRIPIPPPEEQAAIVQFLDHAGEQIRRYIAGKERLIALLEEERQALVHQAVTRGLDPNVKLKDSGVEWLGDVPEHWEIGPLKRFAARYSGAIKAGPFGSQLTLADMTGTDFKVYTQRNVIDRDLEKGFTYISNAKFHDLRAFEIVPGDVLVTSRGTIGRTALVANSCERGVLHPCLLRIHPDHERLVPEFLMTLIQDSQLLPQQLMFLSNSTTIDVIYSSTLANTVVPVPPLTEQVACVEHLDRVTANIDDAIDRSRRQTALMNEYRTRLIADVVTGQLDVREAAEELPTPEPTEITD